MLGTALFVFAIFVSGGNPIGVPLGLFASILFFGGITGGHFNPAVSLGVYLTRDNKAGNAVFLVMIIVGQCLGAILGIFMSFVSLYSKPDDYHIGVANPINACPKDYELDAAGAEVLQCDGIDGNGFELGVQTFYTEVVCTFIFVAVILMVKGKDTAPTGDGMLGATTVTFTLAGLIQTGMRLGPVFNPAVAVAFSFMNAW